MLVTNSGTQKPVKGGSIFWTTIFRQSFMALKLNFKYLKFPAQSAKNSHNLA